MTRSLTLVDELVLTLLNEESGYFRQVPGWSLNCAVVGAALAELSLISRIDTDLDSLILHRSTYLARIRISREIPGRWTLRNRVATPIETGRPHTPSVGPG